MNKFKKKKDPVKLFKKDAAEEGLKEATIEALLKEDYDSKAALREMRDEDLEALGLSAGQRGLLKAWIRRLQSETSGTTANRTSTEVSTTHTEQQNETQPLLSQNTEDHQRECILDRDEVDPVSSAVHTRVKRPSGEVFELQDMSPPAQAASRQTAARAISPEDGNRSSSTASVATVAYRDTADNDIELAVDALAAHSDETPFEETVQAFAEAVNKYKEADVRIGVVGRSASGKSTLINSILNLDPRDQNAAKVDVIECTDATIVYKHPEMPNVLLCDLPGVGTTKFKRSGYLQVVKFSMYDAFIIIVSDRIYDDDIWLAKEAEKIKSPYYFVRSKIDQDIRNQEDYLGHKPEFTVKKIRNNFNDILAKEGLEAQIFLVSGFMRYHSEWDFPELMEELIKRTPKKNSTALVIALVSCSESIIDKKKKRFESRLTTVAKRSLSVKDNMVELLKGGKEAMIKQYKDIIIEELKSYKEQFGLTDEKLHSWSLDAEKLEPSIGVTIADVDKSIKALETSEECCPPLFAKSKAEKAKQKAEGSTKVVVEDVIQFMRMTLQECADASLHVLEARRALVQEKA